LSTLEVKSAALTWYDQVHPHSSLFDDHYYSLIDGLNESRHVFLQGNDLESRWQQLSNCQTFSIMETGFGSGLNFLTSWQLWNSINTNKSNKLNYISVEAYPMNSDQLVKSLSNWKNSLSDLSEQLLTGYPALKSGSHRIDFEKDNVSLILIFEDVRTLMPKLVKKHLGLIDAWFLDGFSPAKNPQMWQSDLYQHIYQLSKPDATVSTYTVAGVVKRGLSKAGFSVYCKPGFGTKREMLTARKSAVNLNY
jgi:tRNA 5-methylaminomethyl-2-thiouridine biosynthesis bifunctional protein